jgi:2-polyprenyl-3-methyl-5-hydroxy-6-metoxy-1,4-benzoquinol methylase
VSIPGAAVVQRLLAGLAPADGPRLAVLEAGCGRYRHIRYPDAVEITGLDISAEQIANNEYAHEKIVGDVQTWQTERHWDAVICIYLLEHVDDPARAVRNLLSWARPGGLVVIAVPNLHSLKGLVTRATPFAFHHWFYQHVYRRPYAIFPTTMKPAIAPRRLRRQFAGHEIVHEEFSQEHFSPSVSFFYRVAINILKFLTLWRWRPEDSNYLLIARRAITPAKDEERGS